MLPSLPILLLYYKAINGFVLPREYFTHLAPDPEKCSVSCSQWKDPACLHTVPPGQYPTVWSAVPKFPSSNQEQNKLGDSLFSPTVMSSTAVFLNDRSVDRHRSLRSPWQSLGRKQSGPWYPSRDRMDFQSTISSEPGKKAFYKFLFKGRVGVQTFKIRDSFWSYEYWNRSWKFPDKL